jgi:hypothetical protein
MVPPDENTFRDGWKLSGQRLHHGLLEGIGVSLGHPRLEILLREILELDLTGVILPLDTPSPLVIELAEHQIDHFITS